MISLGQIARISISPIVIKPEIHIHWFGVFFIYVLFDSKLETIKVVANHHIHKLRNDVRIQNKDM